MATGAEPWVIGQSIALQGGQNAYGQEALAGVRAVIETVNRAGGVAGRALELRTLDDQNQAAQAEANARQLVADGATLLFGSIEGGPSVAVMKVAVDLGVPFFGPMAGSPELRRPHQPLVFPVRAEHRDEFRALLTYAARTGLRRAMLFHADSDTGRQHLANVQALAPTLQIGFAGGLPFRPDISDAQLDVLVRTLASSGADLVFNHGSPGLYERLIRRARQAGVRASFWGVNSGSTPLAASLGPLARNMVFTQIVPSPQARKTALTRDYQAVWRSAHPEAPFSYGSLEGAMTARALVAALQVAGPGATRATLARSWQTLDIDLGGVHLRYRPGEHLGSTFVDLAMVGPDGRFIQ